MSKLDQLPQISAHVLNGLRADENLKSRIYQKAAQTDAASSRTAPRRRTLIALCSLSAVMIAVFVLLGALSPDRRMSDSPAAVQMQTVSAGEHLDESPVQSQDVTDEYGQSDEELPDEAEEDSVNQTKDRDLSTVSP